MFSSDIDTTLNTFSQMIGESTGVSLQVKNGVYMRLFNVVSATPQMQVSKLTKAQIITNLQQSAIRYQFKLAIPTSPVGAMVTKYYITSKLSPVFLLNHGALEGVAISDISMAFDKNSSVYSWTIQGGF